MEYQKQVAAEHYNFQKYFFPARWMSYYYQIKELVSRQDIQSVLDVGPGTTFLHDQLKIHRPDMTYKTADIAEDVSPDIVGGITQLPVSNESFDAVCAFQVLEHIEYGDVEKALQEMSRVSKKYVLISVPHFGPTVQLFLKVPFVRKIQTAFRISYPVKHAFNGQHYWELGKRGYTAKRFRKLLTKHFVIIDEYVPFENQYHRFYTMKKKDAGT